MSEGRKRLKRTPEEKKRLELERDTVYAQTTNPKVFRKNWPRKKRRLSREHRHSAKQALQALPPEAAEQRVKSLRREVAEKWEDSAMPLGKAIARKKKRRIARSGRKKKSQALYAEARALGASGVAIMTRGSDEGIEVQLIGLLGPLSPAPEQPALKPRRKERSANRLPTPE
ncbi:MAG TPA: hypothetical protein VFT98_13110 [Myxococcota bacterium]|nr:hypothetical protein [Myxococcota bacterium]